MGSAQLILVDTLVSRGICRIGDEDWYQFGAVGGKVYTIDIPRMDDGLDLSLDLYDPDGNVIESNDDYYNRPSSVTGSGPSDIRPQIDSGARRATASTSSASAIRSTWAATTTPMM